MSRKMIDGFNQMSNMQKLDFLNEHYSPKNNDSVFLRWKHDRALKYNCDKAVYLCCCSSDQKDMNMLAKAGGELTVGLLVYCYYSIRYCPEDAYWRTENCRGICKDAWSDPDRHGAGAHKLDAYLCGTWREAALIKYERDGYSTLQGNDEDNQYDEGPAQQVMQ